MKIIDIINQKNRTLSFEVFPPKTSDKFDSVREATEKIAELAPDYMSVTYGAGGKGARYTLPIAANIEQKYAVPVVHHLTCVDSTVENIDERLIFMKMVGVENVLALRGDLPEGAEPSAWDFRHANELVAHIKARGGFCIGGACYPGKHPEARSFDEDIANLKLKVDAGCEYLTTQLFAENATFFSFMQKLAKAGISVPVVAGVMPITSVRQFDRIFQLSGERRAPAMVIASEKYHDDAESFRRAGIEYACAQIRELYDSGVKNVHIYTMNSAATAAEIKSCFSEYLK